MNQILHTSLTNPDGLNSTVLLLFAFAYLISVSVMLYFQVFPTIVCEVGKINLSNAMLSKSVLGRWPEEGDQSQPRLHTRRGRRERRARGEKAAAFVFLILHPGQRGEGSSGVATGAVHLIILVFSLFLLSIQLRGQKSNCQ